VGGSVKLGKVGPLDFARRTQRVQRHRQDRALLPSSMCFQIRLRSRCLNHIGSGFENFQRCLEHVRPRQAVLET
jgi:hypothetical protein